MAAAQLRALGGREVELRRELSEAAERVAPVDAEVVGPAESCLQFSVIEGLVARLLLEGIGG